MPKTNKGHRFGIDTLIINAHDDIFAPPEQPVLEIAVVGDVTFLMIRKVVEDNFDTTTLKTINEIGVDTITLASALLGLLKTNEERK